MRGKKKSGKENKLRARYNTSRAVKSLADLRPYVFSDEAEKLESELRIKALKTVKSPDLPALKDECIKLLINP